MKTLIVIDMQKDFIDGSLGTKEAQAIVPNVAAKIKEYEKNGDEIIFTRDTHGADYLHTREGRNLPVPHCIRGTEGWEIVEQLRPASAGQAILDKPSFGSMELAKAAMENNYEKIELVGLVSNICVLTNAAVLKTALPEAEITVDAACTASFDPKANTEALDSMESIQINVINRKDD